MGRTWVPVVFLLLLQGLDIALHAATGQVEPMRVTSNGVIALGAIASIVASNVSKSILLVAGLAYLLLNAVFLLQHGVINPQTEALRVPLFGFMVLSLVLVLWMTRTSKSGDVGQ